MREHELERTERRVRLAIDPHDGHCHGLHDVVVIAEVMPLLEGEKVTRHVQVTYTWKGSALLSERGTLEFMDAIQHAITRGQQLRIELEHEE